MKIKFQKTNENSMIKAYAVKKAKGLLEPFEYKSNPLSKYAIELNISHYRICYSDVHLIDC